MSSVPGAPIQLRISQAAPGRDLLQRDLVRRQLGPLGDEIGQIGEHQRFLRPSATSPMAMSATSAGERSSRSEEHTSELQSLMRISYAVFCLNNKNHSFYRFL